MAKMAFNRATDLLQEAARPSPPDAALVEMGEAGSRDSLARLKEAVSELRANAAAPVLRRSVDALNREDFVAGGKWAVKALELDERNGVGWYLLGIARERAGDFANSVKAYEAALALLPEHGEVANNLGRLAFRMGMLDQAEKLFLRFLEHSPGHVEGVNNLATVYREKGRVDEAIEVLKAGLAIYPEAEMLWNTLGSVMVEQEDHENAFIFFTEAVRLNPKFGKARYNLSQVKQALGDSAGAMKDCEAALTRVISAEDRQMMLLARSSYNLMLGRLSQGWDDYEARLSPQFHGVTHFHIDRPKWKPGANLRGKSFLVVGEQGLGDEVLFANLLRDVAEKVGPEGKLRLVVEHRLIPLFQRSFPDAEVTRHITNVVSAQALRRMPDTDLTTVDLWTPIASLLREYRRSHAAFPDHRGYLTPDPARVAHWKAALEEAPAGPKVGLLWKSNVSKGRKRFFSPFEQWKPILTTPGVSFVNLQYGDCEAELAQAEREFGVKIWQPPGIDLKQDLDDVAALCAAMDLVIGFANATFNLASACGTPSWLVSSVGSWPRLGTDHYPWYPQTRVFLPDAYGDWDSAMLPMAEALAEYAAART